MTTHDRINETTPSPEVQPAAAGTTQQVEHPEEPTVAATQPSTAQPEPAVPPDTERTLFAGEELVGLRSRWDNVQAAFVDDPKECVHKADGLVADVVDQLTVGFAETRSRLEEQWDRGEEASTEDLRQALRRYRDFFERLLAV